MKLLATLTGILLLNSCTFFLNSATDEKYDVINIGDKKKIKIIFSHNINGETHPCGCRQNPLGGLAQVAGAIHEQKQDAKVVYVDTGDTFFPSASFPATVEKSLYHTANTLAQAMDMLELKYFVPGDQDFAGDMRFFTQLNATSKFQYLLSNLKKESQIKHKKFSVIKHGPHQIFLMGVVDPTIVSVGIAASQFNSPLQGITETFKEVEKAGYKKDNPFHRLILLSHAGLDADEKIAKDFPHFDWIIGAHSQSFTRFPLVVGKTKPVQVLSRNHYLGVITFDLTKDKKADNFEILEMRDEQKDKIKPNQFLAFIDKHKAQLKAIQEAEQDSITDKTKSNGDSFPIPTAKSCIECHADQGDFWMGTSHSIAFATLMTANEEKNLSCVKCHSHGMNMNNGFATHSELIRFEPEAYQDENIDKILEEGSLAEREKAREAKIKKLKANYWLEVGEIFKDVKSIRKLDTEKRKKLSGAWHKLEEKHQVSHNYANVQCLNCHDKHIDHPFTNHPTKSAEKKYESMKGKCLSCHVPDQSPEWYDKTGKLKEVHLVEQMKKISCPASEE